MPGIGAERRQVGALATEVQVEEAFAEAERSMHRGAPFRQLDVEFDGRDERLPDRARLFGVGGRRGGGAGDELVSAEGTGGAAAVGREPGGDAVEAKLVAARETDGVFGGVGLVTDGTAIAV